MLSRGNMPASFSRRSGICEKRSRRYPRGASNSSLSMYLLNDRKRERERRERERKGERKRDIKGEREKRERETEGGRGRKRKKERDRQRDGYKERGRQKQ